MKIVEILDNSTIDYLGYFSAVIFMSGCNFNCWWCHNRELISGEAGDFKKPMDIVNHLKKLKLIDAVVITGGEPTIQDDLIELCRLLKKHTNLKIKLDTNGSRPDVLKEIINENLIDAIAMDIKYSLYNRKKFYKVVCVKNYLMKVRESAYLLGESNIETIFRTTILPGFNLQTITDILASLHNYDKYILQQFKSVSYEDIFKIAKTLSEKYNNLYIYTTKNGYEQI